MCLLLLLCWRCWGANDTYSLWHSKVCRFSNNSYWFLHRIWNLSVPPNKEVSPQNKHQTWKHLEIGEHVTPENIIHWILSDQLHHLLNLFLSVTQSSQGWICWRDNHQSTWHGWRETMTKLPLPTTTEILCIITLVIKLLHQIVLLIILHLS